MGFFKQLGENISYYGKRFIPGAQINNQEVGLTQLNIGGAEDPADREAIYPQWFFSSRLGQPRRVDTQKIRDLAQSSWVQMVLNTFKKQIYTTPWDVLVEDDDDESDHKEDIKTVKDFLNNINDNQQTINDVTSESITDVAEIDAGCWNFVYSADSYLIGDVPVYDAWGKVMSTDTGLILKPLGQRTIIKVKAVDGSSMLKQVDIHKNLLSYWQYSFKHPRRNPTRFEKEEIVYLLMNGKSYSVYGFSPVQSIQQVLELLIQGTRYNKDLYTNNAIPDLIVSLPKLPLPDLEKLKRSWNNRYKGRPHQVGFINWAIDKFHKLVESNRDLEWLDGQKWYFKIVFAVFGVSATEAGFFENANKSNDDGQERVTVRNALKPYFKLFEQNITNRMITEILQKEDHGLKFVYKPKDHVLEKIEFEQDMQELDHDTLTINEFRKKKGRKDVEWGDEPMKEPVPVNPFANVGGNQEGNLGAPVPPNPNKPNEPPKKPPKKDDKNEKSVCKCCQGKIHKDLEIDAGDDIVEESKDYSEFLSKLFDRFEERVLAAASHIEIEKAYVEKTFGDFLTNLFNIVNTVAFAKHIKRFLRADLITGMVSAESELDVDIGFNQSYEDKLNQLYQQQLNGYTINGKLWPGIKGVTKEIQSKVIITVQNGVKDKKSITEIKDDIKETFDNFTDWRSKMIARSETNRVLNEGKLLGYKSTDIEGGKTWKTAPYEPGRSSQICQRLGRKYGDDPIPLDEEFIDDETKRAFMTPPALPNCRSTIAFRPK